MKIDEHFIEIGGRVQLIADLLKPGPVFDLGLQILDVIFRGV